MAPAPQTQSATDNAANSGPQFNSLESFLNLYGLAEYALYKKTATDHLSYDGWISSDHVLGPYLYHLTLDALADDSDSDDEIEDEPPSQVAEPEKPDQNPALTVTTNGNGDPHSARATSTIGADAKLEGVAPSTKKKRRLKKVEAASPPPPPEEINSPTPVSGTATPKSGVASPDGPGSSSANRRGLRTRTPAQQRPYFHHAKLFDEAEEAVLESESTRRPFHRTSRLSQVFGPDDESVGESTDEEMVNGIDTRPESPDKISPAKELPSTRNEVHNAANKIRTDPIPIDDRPTSEQPKPKKRGRPRKHPLPPDNPANLQELPTQKPKRTRGRPKKTVMSEEFVHSEGTEDDEGLQRLKNGTTIEEALQYQQASGKSSATQAAELKAAGISAVDTQYEEPNDDVESAGTTPRNPRKAKKTSLGSYALPGEGEEDEEVTRVAPRKRRQSKKMVLSPDIVQDSDEENEEEVVEAPRSAPRKRRQSKKIVLSQELVHDTTEEENEEETGIQMETPKKQRRPRKTPISAELVEDDDDEDSEPMLLDETPKTDEKPKMIVKFKIPPLQLQTVVVTEKMAETASALANVSAPVEYSTPKRTRKPSKKKILSAEVIQDEDEDDSEDEVITRSIPTRERQVKRDIIYSDPVPLEVEVEEDDEEFLRTTAKHQQKAKRLSLDETAALSAVQGGGQSGERSGRRYKRSNLNEAGDEAQAIE
ncbi:hypothetical protein P154DRAFT_563447 [Amniculicola lignicola CBS 123094]|uniref:Uncharacterized protein n=1 Tax=Amniculicola lignicola CBS 123094 TaxID=1392246 RepID=A0A6A5WEY8_9PLEO|nr:hypothetical protein P154DRAFT_563447 [Amniculicola lignicola CBS 123094]